MVANRVFVVTAASVSVTAPGAKNPQRHRRGRKIEIPEKQAERLLRLKAIKPADEVEAEEEEAEEEADLGDAPDRPEDGSTDRAAWMAYAKYYEVPFANNAGAAKIEEAVKKAESEASGDPST